MSEILPLFPLQLVAFPEERLNLHIFEPRYRQLIQDCETTGSHFGIPSFLEGNLQNFGTEMELVRIEKTYPDGKMDIRTKGLSVFRIDEYFEVAPDKLYAGGIVKRISNNTDGDIVLSKRLVDDIGELYRIMNIKKEVPTVEGFSSFAMGHHVGFTVEQEYEMLQIGSESQRQEFMLAHLERLIPITRQMESLRKRVQMNGHFKNIIPPI